MRRAPGTLQRAGDRRLVGLAAAVAQLGALVGVPLPVEDGPDDGHAGHPGDVAHDVGQLQVHLLEGLWHVLDRVRGVGDEQRALAEVAAPHADLVVGPEGGRQPPERVPRLDPLAVADVGLSAGHALELPRVDQLDLEARAR